MARVIDNPLSCQEAFTHDHARSWPMRGCASHTRAETLAIHDVQLLRRGRCGGQAWYRHNFPKRAG